MTCVLLPRTRTMVSKFISKVGQVVKKYIMAVVHPACWSRAILVS